MGSAKAGVRSGVRGMDGRRRAAPDNLSRVARRQKRKGSGAVDYSDRIRLNKSLPSKISAPECPARSRDSCSFRTKPATYRFTELLLRDREVRPGSPSGIQFGAHQDQDFVYPGSRQGSKSPTTLFPPKWEINQVCARSLVTADETVA